MARRDLALVGALMVIIVLLAALAGRQAGTQEDGDPRASTYVRSSHGLAALYWTLQELGVPVARRTEPLLDADSVRGTLAIVAPYQPLSADEMGAVAEYVRRGGTLLFVGGDYDMGGPAYDTLGLDPRWLRDASAWDAQSGRATATPLPHRWTEGVGAVRGFRRGFELQPPRPRSPLQAGRMRRRGADTATDVPSRSAERLLQAEGRPVAVTWRLGEGRVIALADAGPLTNGALRSSGAALLVARALKGAAPRDTVFFDEYHHGFTGGGSLTGGTWTMLRRFVSGAAAVQLLAAIALLLWITGRRFGAPLQPPPARRRSPLEHVEALAGAYRQAEARRTVRRLLLAGLARRLGRRAPPDERAAAEMLERMARQSPVGRDAAAGLEREWKRGAAGDLVGLTRGVDRLLDEVKR